MKARLLPADPEDIVSLPNGDVQVTYPTEDGKRVKVIIEGKAIDKMIRNSQEIAHG